MCERSRVHTNTLCMNNAMPVLKNEIPTEEELNRYFIEGQNAGLCLIRDSYATQYPGCEPFCTKAREIIFECLCRLNRLPRSDPFWTGTNRRPTIPKLRDYCKLILKDNPHDAIAIWTMGALDVWQCVDGFGYEHWKALHGLGNFDVSWPICAALLQGGPGGISDVALATLLMEMGAIEAAQPFLQEYANSERSNINAWAKRVLSMFQGKYDP